MPDKRIYFVNTILIFTDAATSPQKNIAVGAYLYLNRSDLQKYIDCSMEDLSDKLNNLIVYQKYVSKKSTWSEIKNVIDSLNSLQKQSNRLTNVEIYTDCQSLCDLLGKRKDKLLKTNFITRSGKILANADLYKELYAIVDQFNISTFKIKGHDSQSNRTRIEERIFSVIDKLCRRKLRSLLLL